MIPGVFVEKRDAEAVLFFVDIASMLLMDRRCRVGDFCNVFEERQIAPFRRWTY